MILLAKKSQPDYVDYQTVITIGSCEYEAFVDFDYKRNFPYEDDDIEFKSVMIDLGENGTWWTLPAEMVSRISDKSKHDLVLAINDVDNF
jgi:hypothetical protein